MIRKVFLGNMKSLDDTMKTLQFEIMDRAVRRLCECTKIVFFGIGTSGHIAGDAAMRFSLLGFNASAHTDPTEIIFHSSIATKNHCIVCLSHSGRSRITLKGCELSRKREALTIGIANYLQSPLEKAAEFFFCTSFPEQEVKVAAITSRIAQICIIDAMFLLSTKYRDVHIDYDEINNITDTILRV
jgi:DNA-binding MurR/RpiR family transcriptional regulator